MDWGWAIQRDSCHTVSTDDYSSWLLLEYQAWVFLTKKSQKEVDFFLLHVFCSLVIWVSSLPTPKKGGFWSVLNTVIICLNFGSHFVYLGWYGTWLNSWGLPSFFFFCNVCGTACNLIFFFSPLVVPLFILLWKCLVLYLIMPS